MIFTKHLLRGVEKTPGVNLMQLATFKDTKVVMTPKVGTRSIRDALLIYNSIDVKSKDKAWNYIDYTTRYAFMKNMNNNKTLLVVRDPFERVYSCWKQKISDQRDKSFFYFFQYYPIIRPGMNFHSFLKALTLIPTVFYEKHFMPISHGLDINALKVKLCRLSDIDNLLTDITGIQRIPVSNKTKTPNLDLSKDIEFFNDELAERFKNDYILLNKAVSDSV